MRSSFCESLKAIMAPARTVTNLFTCRFQDVSFKNHCIALQWNRMEILCPCPVLGGADAELE